MRYDNGNETAMGAASGGNAPNCSEPTMNCDVGRKPWRSERHLLSLARSGCSVRYHVSLGGCHDSTPAPLGSFGDLIWALREGPRLPGV